MQSSICRRILRLRVINFKCQWCSVSSILTMRSWENVGSNMFQLEAQRCCGYHLHQSGDHCDSSCAPLGRGLGQVGCPRKCPLHVGSDADQCLGQHCHMHLPCCPGGCGMDRKTRIYDSTTFYDLGKPGFVMSAFGFPAEPIPLNGLIGAVLAAVMSSAVYLLVRVLKGARGEVGACRLVFPLRDIRMAIRIHGWVSCQRDLETCSVIVPMRIYSGFWQGL